jgi:hypothetical protein
MKLNKSNRFMKSPSAREAGLLVSAKTSSAVEGIHAPFAKGKLSAQPTSTKAFIARWKRRGAANAR